MLKHGILSTLKLGNIGAFLRESLKIISENKILSRYYDVMMGNKTKETSNIFSLFSLLAHTTYENLSYTSICSTVSINVRLQHHDWRNAKLV